MIPPQEYAYILANMPIICVDVAIFFNGKILLVKRNNEPAKGEWWFPGGRLFKNESLEACALRKAKEETGLDCQVVKEVHHAATDFGAIHSINFCYLLLAKDDNVILDSQSEGFRWIDDITERYHPYMFDCLVRVIACK